MMLRQTFEVNGMGVKNIRDWWRKRREERVDQTGVIFGQWRMVAARIGLFSIEKGFLITGIP